MLSGRTFQREGATYLKAICSQLTCNYMMVKKTTLTIIWW